MTDAILPLLLAAASAIAAMFWKQSSEARGRAQREINELREQARRAQAERSAQAEQAYKQSKQATDQLTDSQADRQKLADLLNEE
jgi:DNA-binding transcriptional regulator GbsR (MarR family)